MVRKTPQRDRAGADGKAPALPKRRGRASAGHDPRKRNKIMDGARKLFFQRGFDVTSMEDIARESGVSKATLYVYFKDKEQLFATVVREDSRRLTEELLEFDVDDKDVRKVLGRLGRALTKAATAPYVVNALRAVISVGDRMPEVGLDYYEQSPFRLIGVLSAYLARQAERGILRIDDTELAAAQFLDLAQSTLSRRLLFGVGEVPGDERIGKVVDAAVRVFLAAYGRRARA